LLASVCELHSFKNPQSRSLTHFHRWRQQRYTALSLSLSHTHTRLGGSGRARAATLPLPHNSGQTELARPLVACLRGPLASRSRPTAGPLSLSSAHRQCCWPAAAARSTRPLSCLFVSAFLWRASRPRAALQSCRRRHPTTTTTVRTCFHDAPRRLLAPFSFGRPISFPPLSSARRPRTNAIRYDAMRCDRAVTPPQRGGVVGRPVGRDSPDRHQTYGARHRSANDGEDKHDHDRLAAADTKANSCGA
jgi:hypothetical protein